jgi:hypothetical protein
MRLTMLVLVLLVLAQGVASADEFYAWVFLVDGHKVSFVKDDKTSKKKGVPDVPPKTLTVADNVQVLQGSPNPETKTYEGAIVESGLDYPLLKELKLLGGNPKKGKRYHLTQLVTNDENKITEIRLHDDVVAKIVKIDGNTVKIRQLPGGGFYGGKDEGFPLEHRLPDNVKIVIGWLNPKTKKFEGTPVEGGLKNDIFKSAVRARVTYSDTTVILIRVFDPAKITDNKK